MFATAEGLLTQQDLVNSDGLQEVFATNLFGHFLLVQHTYRKSKMSSPFVVRVVTETVVSLSLRSRSGSWSLCCVRRVAHPG